MYTENGLLENRKSNSTAEGTANTDIAHRGHKSLSPSLSSQILSSPPDSTVTAHNNSRIRSGFSNLSSAI